MIAKKFDPILYTAHDGVARTRVKDYLNSWKDNQDKYGPDLVLSGSTYVEVEVKTVWSGPKFPWPTVQIAERKGKWRDLNISFWLLNREHTHAIVIIADSLNDDRLVIVPNKYGPEGERFFQVPIEECSMVMLPEPVYSWTEIFKM